MTIEDAKQIANGLIQSYIGPDSRVVDMPSFYGALRRSRKPLCGLSAPWVRIPPSPPEHQYFQ
jgi:hypothetical protein